MTKLPSFYHILSGIKFGNLFGIHSGMHCVILSATLSDIHFGILSGLHSGVLFGIHSGILPDINSGILSGIL